MTRYQNSDNSPTLLSDLLSHLTSVRSLKQLFITVVLMVNVVMLYDLVFNQAKGLNSLINAYRAVYPDTERFVLSDRDIQFLTEIVAEYPDGRISVLELTKRAGISPVQRYDTSRKIILYTEGTPSVIIAISSSLPDSVYSAIYYYFKGYEAFTSPSSEPTKQPTQPSR